MDECAECKVKERLLEEAHQKIGRMADELSRTYAALQLMIDSRILIPGPGKPK